MAFNPMGSGMGAKSRIQERMRVARAAMRDLYTGLQLRNFRLHGIVVFEPKSKDEEGMIGNPRITHMMLLCEQAEFILSEIIEVWQDYLREETTNARRIAAEQRQADIERLIHPQPQAAEDEEGEES